MVIILATKKKFKLKKKFRRLIFICILLGCLAFSGIKIYEVQKYHKTNEYKLLEKGYDDKTIELLSKSLSKEHFDYILKEDKIDYISKIVGEKYYIDDLFYKYLSYYEENSKKSFSDVIAIVNVGADKSWYEGATTTDTSDRYTMLVNKYHTLPDDFDAGTIKKFSATYAYGEVSAEETCYNAFIEMAKAAKEEGITLILTSGYRSKEKQTTIYEDMKNQKGEKYAEEFAARPGSSEHETGLSLDIFTYGGTTDTFKDTPTYTWLHENAYKYGFIERYPEGKKYLTGYEAEAWHYRYLGVDMARKVYNEGITYDEYYAFYMNK